MKSTRHRRYRKISGTREIEERPDEPLYHAGPRLRQLKVVLDVDSLDESHADEKSRLLRGLLAQNLFSVTRYSDEGPPADLIRDSAHGLGKYAEGWLLLSADKQLFTYGEGGERLSRHSLMRNGLIDSASHDSSSGAYRYLSDIEAAERRATDMRLLAIASALKADLLITDRPYARDDPYRAATTAGLEVLSPSEALAAVGLYLRQQHEFIVKIGDEGIGRLDFNRGLMYWVASRSLLPAGWRWMTACVQHSTHTGNDLLTHYAGTAHHRMETALRARDSLFVALNQPQDNDTADDAMEALDNLLVALSAAMDVTARVLNYSLGQLRPPHLVGWARAGWIERLRARLPVAAALADDAHYGRVIRIVSTLRNTVHGAALSPMAVSTGSLRRVDTVVGLPSERLDHLLVAMDAMGGHESWGVRKLIPGQAHADLDVLCERLLAELVPFLNDAMRLTPVETLDGVLLTEEDLRPPEGAQDAFRLEYRRSILWQFGLESLADAP